jgi:hypothetical protein
MLGKARVAATNGNCTKKSLQVAIRLNLIMGYSGAAYKIFAPI